jgi:hypothetical protein
MGDDDDNDKLVRGVDGWETPVAVEYFRGCGENFDAISAEWSARQKEAAAKASAEPDYFARSLPWPTRIAYRVGRWLFRRWWNADSEPAEEERLFGEGKFKLVYAAKDSKQPSPRQRDAWNQIIARGDAAWDELMSLMIAEYQRQHPIRVRWWRAIYGDCLLDHALPEVRDAAGMKRLVRPIEFRVKRVRKDAPAADVAAWFMCTWNTDGVVALLRDGRAVEIGAIDLLMPMKKRPGPALDHPVFGPLRRIPDDDPWEVVANLKPGERQPMPRGPYPWEGTMRCEPLRDYFLAADDRASFKFDPAHAEQPQSAMPWDFAQGNFDLRVYAPPGHEPSDAQAQAFAAFKADEARHVATIVAAVYEHYTTNFEKHRTLWRDENITSQVDTLAARAVRGVMGGGGERNPGFIEEVIPKLDSADGLHDRMWLKHVHVHPSDDEGRVTIAFQFVCTWIGDGFTVHWRDSQVEKIGRWKSAEPKVLA